MAEVGGICPVSPAKNFLNQAKNFLHFFTSKKNTLVQCAALPFVICDDGMWVLLVTTRKTRRWILPKGWPKMGHSPHEIAAKEAFEEAGVKGCTFKDSIGSYSEKKRLHVFVSVPCNLNVYPLEVTEQHIHWREEAQRDRIWLPVKEAADRLSNKGLAQIIVNFSNRWHCDK
ncbi:MAG: NUDIX hydrolase [Hyphomicrobiaceae bacterium]